MPTCGAITARATRLNPNFAIISCWPAGWVSGARVEITSVAALGRAIHGVIVSAHLVEISPA